MDHHPSWQRASSQEEGALQSDELGERRWLCGKTGDEVVEVVFQEFQADSAAMDGQNVESKLTEGVEVCHLQRNLAVVCDEGGR